MEDPQQPHTLEKEAPTTEKTHRSECSETHSPGAGGLIQTTLQASPVQLEQT